MWSKKSINYKYSVGKLICYSSGKCMQTENLSKFLALMNSEMKQYFKDRFRKDKEWTYFLGVFFLSMW